MNEISAFKEDGNTAPILQEILMRVTAIEHLLHSHSPSRSELISEETLPALNWTASKTDLIELIYGLYVNKVFNNGKITIKAITHFFEDALDVKLGNTSLRFQEILRRKDSVAFFVQVRTALEVYMSRIDEKSA